MKLPVMPVVSGPRASVPCGTCHECCRDQRIALFGSEAARFAHTIDADTGVAVLATRANGDCVYLDRANHRCERWADAPEICRKFDCRKWVANWAPDGFLVFGDVRIPNASLSGPSPRMIEAARRAEIRGRKLAKTADMNAMSETVLEMAAERDPAKWAATQIIKGGLIVGSE